MPALQWPGSFVRSHNIFVGGKLQRRRSLVHHPPCIFNAPATKRKRRRNETRILELEKKLEEVRQSVSMSHSIGQQASTASGVSTSTTPTSFDEIIGLLPPGAAPTWLRAPVSREEVEQVSFPQDPVTRGLVQLSTASELCVKFCEELLPRYPLVLPPSPLSLPVLRQHHPALFRAILATASSSYSPDHWRLLFGDAERYVVEQATITGKKSLDLAQAAIVLATWSYPPDRFEDLNFSQFANIAANIVIDLRSSGDERYHIPAEHNCTQTEVDLEAARTFLASYFLCSSIAMSFHRPSIIRYGSWVGDCIDLLGSPSSVHIGDRRLAAWAQLQALAEENLTMAGLNEGSSINSSDPRTLFVLKNGYERAKTWRKHLPSDIMMETLDIHYHVILLNLCQPGLYSSHKSRDFRPPYAISVYDAPEGSAQESLQLVHARMECMHIARTLINLFLNLSAEELRQVPVVVFTRMMYAVVVLTKAEKSFSLSGAASNNGNSESISTTDLLHCILSRLSSAADGCQYRNPAIFFAVLRRLLCSIGDGSPQLLSTQDQVIEPLMNLAISQARHDISVEQDNYPPVESRAFDLESMFSSKQTDPFFVPPFPLDDAMHPIPGNASTDATAIMLWNSILGDEAFP